MAELIASATADDVVVLAGKGHEDYQEIDGKRQPFSDLEEAATALAAWGASE
ncbi:UDP-N-acetylmuramoylalanyl-D-glutamate--2,6-diaminopimelate ligase [Pseudomonas syringae pv. actinidiae ICMP 19096]|uniref:UDP-N-acetylmuramoylalanyl-D-glutamate--2, 6-diaminopimelate ligase n=1 Tax=Pseudomonas syringae pv. actinidiae ICMP 19096 TaxID=1194405 RepID=A0A656JYQ5_PSESF|nr:UDP-N-acetylmuramoylalanyl-D-glutamate--2,6-diaminopimelate ligase [Pseudomonas syringae pv. actinidiae ICMP 19096]